MSSGSVSASREAGGVRVIHADELAWQASPSPHVWRKRLELTGPAEAGRVTSIVRYAGSVFPRHSHPDGEEILVLSGAFEDEFGLHPSRSWLRFPPVSSHSLFSQSGCTLYVKRGHLSESPRLEP